MLLSLFISFLWARMPRKKLYVLFMAIALFLISFVSVGVPTYVTMPKDDFAPARGNTEGLLLNVPPYWRARKIAPLSFPFYSSLYERWPMYFHDGYWEEYRLDFVSMTLHGTRTITGGAYMTVLSFSWMDYILYFLLFLLVNISGAVAGYWITNRRWLYSGVLIGVVVLAPLILLYNPFLPIWNPPRPEVTTVQGYWSNLVYVVDTTVRNDGGAGWVRVYVELSGSGTPMGGYSQRRAYFSKGENQTLQFTFEGFHPPINYSTWAVAD